MTTGTNTPATLSAVRAIGALVFCASSMARMICDRAVSLPILRASTRRNPFLLIVAPVTVSPAALSTGMLSPVSMDSSTALWPSTTTPSTAICSPGRTEMISPTATCSTGISTSFPSRSTTAVLGVRSSSSLIAPAVRPLDRASNVLPSRTRVMMMAVDS